MVFFMQPEKNNSGSQILTITAEQILVINLSWSETLESSKDPSFAGISSDAFLKMLLFSDKSIFIKAILSKWLVTLIKYEL